MSHSLIADFQSQFEATSAAAKLFSLGLSRDALLIEIDERGMQPPSSSNASATVIEPSLAQRDDAGHARLRNDENDEHAGHAPASTVRPPKGMGWARLTIALPCTLADHDVQATLEAAGASRIQSSDRPAPTPNPAMWPENDTADAADVRRAIDASSPRRP